MGEKRVSRKSKDPNCPKKPGNAYILFGNDQRDKLKTEDPTLAAKDVMTRIGKLWHDVSEKDKAYYDEKSKQLMLQYKKELQSYKDQNPDWEEHMAGKPDGKKVKKIKKDPNEPKRPSSAYILFGNSRREMLKKENENLSAKEIMTEIGAMWQAASDEEKAPFIEKAKELQEQFKIDMEDYKTNLDQE